MKNAYFLSSEEVSLILEKTGINLNERIFQTPMEAYLSEEFDSALGFMEQELEDSQLMELKNNKEVLLEGFNKKYFEEACHREGTSGVTDLMDEVLTTMLDYLEESLKAA